MQNEIAQIMTRMNYSRVPISNVCTNWLYGFFLICEQGMCVKTRIEFDLRLSIFDTA